jgi:hypothetical protein
MGRIASASYQPETGAAAEQYCTHLAPSDGNASTSAAAATAMLARSRSGANDRIIPRTARATTATDATLRPWAAAAKRVTDRGNPEAEQHKRDRRRQRKPRPCSNGAWTASARQADGNSDLAAGGAGQKLRKRHQVRTGVLVQPFPLNLKFIAKISEVRNRSPETGEPKHVKTARTSSTEPDGPFVAVVIFA